MAVLNVAQAARRWGVTPESIRVELREGRLRGYRDAMGQWWVDTMDENLAGDALTSRGMTQTIHRLEQRLKEMTAELNELRQQLEGRTQGAKFALGHSEEAWAKPIAGRGGWRFWRK